jgi:iron complex outermembrane recepter protein
MSRKITRKILSTAIAASVALEAAPVMAQMLEEVIVTARKRQESILKVPVTVTAFSSQTLDEFAIGDIRGIADMTPGLNFSTGPLASGVLVSLRGIGTGTNNPAVSQSVALVVDGMQFTQGLAFGASQFDMAQVEVLKGPQALFFGKAAPAGVIAVTTADPTDEVEVRLRAGYEIEAEETVGELILSGPVTDSLGLRLAAQFSDKDGHFSNNAEPVGPDAYPPYGNLGVAGVTGENFPNTETTLLRGTALWRPADDFQARLKLNYADAETEGTGGEPQLVDCPEGTDASNSIFGVGFIAGEDCKADDKQNFAYMDPAEFPLIYNGGEPFSELEQYFGTLDLEYDIGRDLTLSSVTGYYNVDQKSMINGSLTTEVGTPFTIQSDLDADDFTQELRLTSAYGGALNFMVGGFYQKGEIDYLSSLPFNQAYIAFGRVPPLVAGYADHNVESEVYSLFGQVLWQITPDFELGVGARWTDEQREDEVMDLVPTLSGGAAEPVDLGQKNIGDSNWSPEATFTYTPTDELTFYGNLKQAYKSGSFDIGGQVDPGEDVSFGDERVRGGELGIKSRWLDGSLAFNGAAYYYKYDDLQVETKVFDPSAGRVAVRTTNAGSAEIYGIDIDMSYVPPALEGLMLYGGVNWNTAEYDDFDNAACWQGQTLSQGCNIDLTGNGVGDLQDLSGEPLLRAPDWMANVGFNYETTVFNDMTFRLGSIATYSDSYSASSTNLPSAYQDSYTKVNANIGLMGADGKWQIEVIGDNLTDEYVYGNCAPQGYANTLLFAEPLAGTGTANGGSGGAPEVACWVEQGMSVLMRFTWNFF